MNLKGRCTSYVDKYVTLKGRCTYDAQEREEGDAAQIFTAQVSMCDAIRIHWHQAAAAVDSSCTGLLTSSMCEWSAIDFAQVIDMIACLNDQQEAKDAPNFMGHMLAFMHLKTLQVNPIQMPMSSPSFALLLNAHHLL